MMGVILGVAATVVIVFVAIGLLRMSRVLVDHGGPMLVDPDRAAVRKYLRENLGNPEWEKIRWWPAVEAPKRSDVPIRCTRICMLKYRAEMPLLGKVVCTDMFGLADGKATKLPRDGIAYHWRWHYFDE